MVARLDALAPSTLAAVRRLRQFPEDERDLPAVNVVQGEDVPLDDEGQPYQFVDRELTITVEIRGREIDAPDTELNRLEAVIHGAIFTDDTLGLSYVHWCRVGPVSEPEPDPEGRARFAQLNKTIVVRYRAERDDLTT